MSGASEQANGRASDPVLQSVFLAVLYYKERESRRRQSQVAWCILHSIKRRVKGKGLEQVVDPEREEVVRF